MLDADMPELYQLCVLGPAAKTWRFGGLLLDQNTFTRELWVGVHHQVVAVSRQNGNICGLATSLGFTPEHRRTSLSIITDPEAGTAVGAETSFLFIEYLFRCFDLRKISLEVAQPNIIRLQGALRYVLQREGTLQNHLWLDGKPVDLHLFAIFAEEWAKLSHRYARLFRPVTGVPVSLAGKPTVRIYMPSPNEA
jgi:RimJ/RimL family protein N-acetyltransferase